MILYGHAPLEPWNFCALQKTQKPLALSETPSLYLNFLQHKFQCGPVKQQVLAISEQRPAAVRKFRALCCTASYGSALRAVKQQQQSLCTSQLMHDLSSHTTVEPFQKNDRELSLFFIVNAKH
jgi:hypothetical protein